MYVIEIEVKGLGVFTDCRFSVEFCFTPNIIELLLLIGISIASIWGSFTLENYVLYMINRRADYI